MERISKKRSGHKAPWPLADALKWRLRHGGTLDNAFAQLTSLHTDGSIEMVGLIAESHPERDEEPQWYRPFGDPATSHRFGTPLLAVIKPGALSELRPVLDGDGEPTSTLEYATYLSPAWREVELEDRFTARRTWLPLVTKKGRRGPRPKLQESIADKMFDHMRSGEVSLEELRNLKLDSLSSEYGGSPNTADRARDAAIARFSEFQKTEL